MPATSRTELRQVTEKEFEKLSRLLEGIDANTALAKDEDDTSIKDVVAHRAHWIRLFLGWYEDGRSGKEVFFPAQGYNWSELKRYNRDLRSRQADVTWIEACSMLAEAHHTLSDFMKNRTNRQLYGGPMAGARNNWTTGRWAEAAGPSHYRSATNYIRARLRNG